MALCVCVQAKHATEGCMSWGVNGENGEIVDMKEYGVWEAYSVKAQTYKTAIEVCRMQLISVFVITTNKGGKMFSVIHKHVFSSLMTADLNLEEKNI